MAYHDPEIGTALPRITLELSDQHYVDSNRRPSTHGIERLIEAKEPLTHVSYTVNPYADPLVWSYFGDYQTKLTRSFRPEDWLADVPGPDRGEKTRQALAEAAALVLYGRSRTGRHALARAIGREPALAQPWLRTLVTELNS